MKNTRRASMAATALLGLCLTSPAQAQIFVANNNDGTKTIGEYNLDGSTVNPSLVSGLSLPIGLAVSGGDIFVANAGSGTIGEYTTSGATVNASLVSGGGLGEPDGIAVSGGDIFVAWWVGSTIGEYTTTGATVNASLVSGLNGPAGLAVEPVPEPSTYALLAGGLGGWLLWCRRASRKLV